ncbi:DUF4339 domain-containing protein [Bacillus sp. NP157]|nr:DUF4339 domain-containing protein [Bacillus sp. NP157]
MSDERKIWVGRDGQRFGPYDEPTLRAWIAEGKIAATAMGWHDGMAEWRPLHEILGIPLPPPMMGGVAAVQHSDLPAPPDLHWFLIAVIDMFTGGLMSLVWIFLQSSWIKKIDPSSRATLWLIVSVCLLPLGWLLMMGSIFGSSALRSGSPPDFADFAHAMALFPLVMLVGLGSLVFRYIAIFSMARSMREKLPAYGLVPDIGGVTLFFFTHYYLQAQMTWVARWRTTGQVDPPANKVVFWILLSVWAGFMFLVVMAMSLAMFGSVNHG